MIDSGNYSIIVVADGATQGQLLYQTLTAKGYHVEIAETGAEALNKTQQSKPSLFVIDMSTPLLDGYELCREIKTAYQLDNIPVILLMDRCDELDAIKGLDAGADSFASKLCPPESLLHKIESLLSDLPESGEQAQTDPVECHYDGQSYLLTLRPKQTLNLLLSASENGVYQRLELINAQKS